MAVQPGAAFTLRRRITALDNGGATDLFVVLNEIRGASSARRAADAAPAAAPRRSSLP
ncbi:hypothetical protein [Streptomyces sp. 8N616]|uniref:hypothetical protein n=1 Tax=Streptomyces sp. 8N616 TaxID=3457414 RepID=UPI003FD271A9